MFQKKNDPWFTMFVCFALPPLISYFFWNENIIAHYLVEVSRYILVLHGTWFVNSAAHIWGSHPYDPSINPAENRFVALCSVGEGWHNWHHKFPYEHIECYCNNIQCVTYFQENSYLHHTAQVH